MKYPINGVYLNIVEQGSGSLTLIFLHYFGGSALEWQEVMNQLSDHYRCIAIDLRGFGDSEAPETGYSVDNMADDVEAILHLKAVRQFVLVGHSMSGKIALALAARQPVGLQSLILLAPSPPVPEPIPEKDRQHMLDTYGQQTAAEQTFEKITNKPVSETSRNQIIADNLRTSKFAWDAWLLGGSKEDISDRMSNITVPIAIIVGPEDRALPPDVQPRMVLSYLKSATLDIIEGVGHLLPWEAPDELTGFIQKKIGEC